MDALPISEKSRRLNLGCGYDKRVGYINIDLQAKHSPDICADITSLPMLESSRYEEIIAQDVLEHLERHKTLPALKEWTRLLAPNGVLHIRIPSLMDLFKMLAQPENRSAEAANEIIHLMYGTQAYTGDYHLSGFTAELITSYLDECGLQICRAELIHNWLFDIQARKIHSLIDPEELVHNAYFRVLGRAADDGGLNHYKLHILENGLTYEDIVAELKKSDEGRFIEKYPKYLLGHIPLEPDGSELN